jgi:hypothetical protein
MSGDNQVVFTAIPNCVELWRHRKSGLTLAAVAKYRCVRRIETAFTGHKPRVIIQTGY